MRLAMPELCSLVGGIVGTIREAEFNAAKPWLTNVGETTACREFELIQ